MGKKTNSKNKKKSKIVKQNFNFNLYFLLVLIFLLGLLLMQKYIYNDGNVFEKILFNIIVGMKILFGKAVYIFLTLAIIYNIVMIYKNKNRVYTLRKISFWLAFISFSALLSLQEIKVISQNDIFEAGQDLLSLAFEQKGGGLIGYITLIPFYSILKETYTYFAFLTMCIFFTFIAFFRNIRLLILMIYKTYAYYNSEDYNNKKKILQAKKEFQKNRNLEEEKKEEEQFVNYFINIKEKKLDDEIYKDENGNMYNNEEFERKKKQWNDYQDKMREFRLSQIQKKEDNKEEPILDNIVEQTNIIEEEKEIEKPIQLQEEILKTFENEEIKDEPIIFEQVEKPDILEQYSFDKIKEREELNKSIEELFKYKNASEEKKEEMKKEINSNIEKLEGVLKNFGIDAKVVEYAAGPTITRYEIKIPFTVKVKRVTELEDNLKMHLKAESIRMEAPIPGKDAIGIETPNKIKEVVYFSNMIRSEKLNEGILPIILGKDIIGKDKIIDITKLPHLLIAGTTGSGKSIAINTMIASLISKKSEDEVKFIMIDPKMVELMPYNGIPHLLTPVIIDPNMAQVALKWAVNEMEERYKKLASVGLKNIESYNKKYSIKMPYIVIVIDELADLMMVASNSVEYSITRIAQKARAIGIHLIVATQRPSVDVVTGMIKANLPSRISFALRSSTDSRTILDQIGAEKLLGKGDMLFLDNGKAKLERIQGAFVTDEEIVKLTDILKSKRKARYNEEILIDQDLNDDSKDPLFDKAVEIAKRQEDRLSISLIQRELRVGYNRAARICDELKNNGIIDQDNRYINLDY